MPDVGTNATIGTNYSALNGAQLSSAYFYSVSASSVSVSESSNGSTSNLSANGSLSGFTQASFSGTQTITIPSTPGFITVGQTTYQVYGASDDGHNLVLGPTDPSSGGPYMVLSDNGQNPSTGFHFSSTNAFTAPAPVCFAAGTMILTTVGEIAVEALTEDHVVVTAGGTARPIRWLGHARIRFVDASSRRDDHPVEIRRGALADNVPNRDLLVSPGHRMLIDGALFQAESLVNGVTVVRKPVALVDYHHVELDAPDALLANGAPAESFVDVGNRARFGEAIGLPATAALLDADPLTETFAPNIKGGPILAAVRARLIERALSLGWSRIVAQGVALDVSGQRIEAAARVGGRHWFVLPEPASEIALLSAAAVCSTVKPDSGDDRLLGVQILSVLADGREVQLHAPAFAEGFHECEDDGDQPFRWTSGHALLRLKRAATVLEVVVGRGAELILADTVAEKTLAVA